MSGYLYIASGLWAVASALDQVHLTSVADGVLAGTMLIFATLQSSATAARPQACINNDPIP